MQALTALIQTICSIDDSAQKALSEIAEIKSYPRNAVVQEIGTSCKTVYWVQSGCARIYYDKDGNDITEYFAFSGDIVVRAESLFTGLPATKGIQTLEETVLVAISSEKLFRLFDTHHDLERMFRLMVEKAFVQTVKRIESLQFKSARERYLELLETTQWVQKIPLKYIASYLGITQVSLSRIRAGI
ncbi:MAG: Crp/Fnr family transcriptional regulator [Bacteroidetes bacterium]|nr:Crp/Fnr family transcriptional regulator [Bacteroidota bacterium]